MSKHNSNKIKYLSFFLAIMVVYIHAYGVESYELGQYTSGVGYSLAVFEGYMRVLHMIAVPFFFTMSGYLFFRNYGWDRVIEKYKSRVDSLLKPYIFWNIAFYLVYVVLTNMSVTAKYFSMEPVKLGLTPLLVALLDSTYTILWFVKDLIICVIFSPVIYGVYKKKNNKALDVLSIVVSLGLIVVCYLKIIDIGINCYFLFGSICALRCKAFVENSSTKKTNLCITGLILMLIWLFVGRNTIAIDAWLFVIIGLIWFSLDVFSLDKEPVWALRQTFFIYCTHSFVLEVAEKLWMKVAGQSVVAASIDYFVIPVVVVTLILSVAYLTNRISGKVYQFLVGGRA